MKRSQKVKFLTLMTLPLNNRTSNSQKRGARASGSCEAVRGQPTRETTTIQWTVLTASKAVACVMGLT